jgi:hypothetical protein
MYLQMVIDMNNVQSLDLNHFMFHYGDELEMYCPDAYDYLLQVLHLPLDEQIHDIKILLSLYGEEIEMWYPEAFEYLTDLISPDPLKH